MLKGAKAYVSTQVTTTTQGDLLIMLYDAAIKFLNQAKVEMDNKDYAKKGILISRAIDILSELSSSLNKDKGGPLAANLNSIYLFCSTQLAKANLRMDPNMIDEVIGLLEPIRDAYAQIVPQYDKPLATSATVSSASAPAPSTNMARPGNMNLTRAYAAQSVKMQQMQAEAQAGQTAAPQGQPAAPTVPTAPAQPAASEAQTAPSPQPANAAPTATPAASATATPPAAKTQQAQSEAVPESKEPPKPEQKTEAKPTPTAPPQPSFTLNAARIRAANAYGNSR